MSAARLYSVDHQLVREQAVSSVLLIDAHLTDERVAMPRVGQETSEARPDGSTKNASAKITQNVYTPLQQPDRELQTLVNIRVSVLIPASILMTWGRPTQVGH